MDGALPIESFIVWRILVQWRAQCIILVWTFRNDPFVAQANAACPHFSFQMRYISKKTLTNERVVILSLFIIVYACKSSELVSADM